MAVAQRKGKWVVDITYRDGRRERLVSPVQTKRGATEYEAQLRAREIERYKAEKLRVDGERRPLAPETINNHLVILRKLLVTAQEWGLIEKLPIIRRLKVPPAHCDWLTPDETARFLTAVEVQYPQWAALFWTALRTGMRRGEIFALQWDDVDLVAGTVTVRHTVFRGKLGSPKGGRSRTIPLSSRLMRVLKDHRAVTFLKSAFVFPGEDGKLTAHQGHVNRPLLGGLKLAGLRRVRFHDLRRCFASQLISAGRSLKEVQDLLGHESIPMRYAHLSPERMKEAVEALEGGPSATLSGHRSVTNPVTF